MGMEETAEILEKAADLYESGRLNWGRHELYDEIENEGCLLGALSIVSNDLGRYLYYEGELTPLRPAPSQTFLDARHALADTIRATVDLNDLDLDEDYDSEVVYVFNDRRTKTQEQAVELLKQAAKDIRNSQKEQ
jgi:hypothetical protein